MVPKQVIEKVEKTISQSKAAKATGSARTKARKERRGLATLPAHPLPMVVDLKKRTKRPHVAFLGARAASRLETEESRAYFDSLLVPENGSAQYPDLSDFPTIPVSSRFTISLTPVQQSTTNAVYSTIVLSANLYDMYNQPSAIDATGVYTWGPDHLHPLYNSYVVNFSQYRPISMCARVINSTNLNNKQGILYQDLCPSVSANQVSTGSFNHVVNVNDFAASPTVKIGAFANEYLEDVPRTCWMPLKLNSLEFIPMDANPNSGNWIAQSSEVPFIGLMIDHQTTDLTKAQSAVVEVWFNFEAVPLYKTQSLFDPRPCVGDPSKTAMGLLENKEALMAGITSTVRTVEGAIGAFATYQRMANAFNGVLTSTSDNTRTPQSLFNRIAYFLKENLTGDIQVFVSEEKSVNALLDSLKKVQVVLKQLDLKTLSLVPHYVTSAPWKKELVAVDVVPRLSLAGEDQFVSVISPRSEKSFRSGSTLGSLNSRSTK